MSSTTTASAAPSGTLVLKRSSSSMPSGTAGPTASPKVAKTKLPHVPPPTYYGCTHIGMMFQQNAHGCKSYYSGAARVALDSERLPAQKCNTCSYILTRTYMCMQCPNTHCPKHALEHSSISKHRFGVDSRNGHVFCFACSDYIYDPTLEEIRIEQEVSLYGRRRKKRRLEDSKPSSDDLEYIEKHSIYAPCRATGLRGFLNMGSTCFMSVILQSLVHNPLIRNFYLSDGHKRGDCMVQHCMSCAMDEVFEEFFTQDKVDGFGPVNLLTTSWKCEQTLAGYQQQDAHEYLQFLLNQLHLNSMASSNSGISSVPDDSTPTPGECTCIIHRGFYGKLQSDVTCSACLNVTTAVDPVMDLSLDLRIKARAKANPNNPTTITLSLSTAPAVQTLQECLARFTATEKLPVNEYNCSNCGGAREATKQLTVKRLPPVLCIQLKRFEHSANGSAKIDTVIRFPLQLDMTPFTTRARRKRSPTPGGGGVGGAGPAQPEKPCKPFIYDLLSVVVHKGEINSGHYISYARENGQWFQFDDSMVTLASEKQVLAAQAYLLFYMIRTLA